MKFTESYMSCLDTVCSTVYLLVPVWCSTRIQLCCQGYVRFAKVHAMHVMCRTNTHLLTCCQVLKETGWKIILAFKVALRYFTGLKETTLFLVCHSWHFTKDGLVLFQSHCSQSFYFETSGIIEWSSQDLCCFSFCFCRFECWPKMAAFHLELQQLWHVWRSIETWIHPSGFSAILVSPLQRHRPKVLHSTQ